MLSKVCFPITGAEVKNAKEASERIAISGEKAIKQEMEENAGDATASSKSHEPVVVVVFDDRAKGEGNGRAAEKGRFDVAWSLLYISDGEEAVETRRRWKEKQEKR